jgi:hypothetical protein
MELVKEAHVSIFIGSNGVEKWRESFLQSFFGQTGKKDITLHLTS